MLSKRLGRGLTMFSGSFSQETWEWLSGNCKEPLTQVGSKGSVSCALRPNQEFWADSNFGALGVPQSLAFYSNGAETLVKTIFDF